MLEGAWVTALHGKQPRNEACSWHSGRRQHLHCRGARAALGRPAEEVGLPPTHTAEGADYDKPYHDKFYYVVYMTMHKQQMFSQGGGRRAISSLCAAAATLRQHGTAVLAFLLRHVVDAAGC